VGKWVAAAVANRHHAAAATNLSGNSFREVEGNMKRDIAWLILGILLVAGCGSPTPTAKNNPPANPPPSGSRTPIPPPGGVVAVKPADNPMPAVIPAQPVAIPAPGANPNPDPPEVKKAGVGVGKKGHYSRELVIGTIIATRWRVEEKLTFEVKIPQAMQIYKATDAQGKGPKSHAEFMDKIIKTNFIKLPELRAGEEYEYDPKTEELMVVSGKEEK